MAMARIKQSNDFLLKQLSSKCESLEKDLADPLDLYHKHYKTQNHEALKEGTQFWNAMHQERTQMLFAKENYFNQCQSLQQILQQYYSSKTAPQSSSNPPEDEDSPFLTLMIQQDKKFWSQYTRMENARSEYEKSVAALNMRIDLKVEAEYYPVLSKLQDNDDGMI